MKALSFVFTLLLCPLAMATIPNGTWLNKNLVADDGGYGSYFRGWLFISETNIDQLTTLGAHYDKNKLSILSDNGQSLQVFDTEDLQTRVITYELKQDRLIFCRSQTSCSSYERTNEKPQTDSPPHSFPKIGLSAKWCVDQDCETIQYSDNQSEFLYNLNSDFKTIYWHYMAPESLMKRQNLKMNLLAYSYRLDNSGQLSSYSTSTYLQVADSETIAKSGVIRLNAGPLTSLSGIYENKKITADFALKMSAQK